MDKYYTPEIEEFHVGFEYDKLDPISKKWKETIIKHGVDIRYKEVEIRSETVRVKYLDNADIKSLDFEYSVHSYGGNYVKDNYEISWWWNKEGIQIKELSGKDFGNKLIFTGKIKNKSELKKLLKQLKIK